MQPEKGITKQGRKLLLLAVLDIYKVYMNPCRMSQKTADLESSRQMLTQVWQPRIAILILSAEVSAGTGLLRANSGVAWDYKKLY